MTKYKVQKRVLQHGKPLSIEKFIWFETERIFVSKENNLVFNFEDIDRVTFHIRGGSHTLKVGRECIIINTDPYEVICPREGVNKIII